MREVTGMSGSYDGIRDTKGVGTAVCNLEGV